VKSLATLVAFLVSIVLIGGPVALGLTFIRTERRAVTYTRIVIALGVGSLSIFIGLILMLSGGAVGSIILGLIGISTGSFATYRAMKEFRDRMR
jgi:hypothetical protein